MLFQNLSLSNIVIQIEKVHTFVVVGCGSRIAFPLEGPKLCLFHTRFNATLSLWVTVELFKFIHPKYIHKSYLKTSELPLQLHESLLHASDRGRQRQKEERQEI